MSLDEGSGSRRDALGELNMRAETIHRELQSAGAPRYPSTTVNIMDVQDRREIGEYLCREVGHDYASSLYLIDNIGMIYREDQDRYLVTDTFLDSEDSSESEALLPHEMGHRFGRKVVEDELRPVRGAQNVSDEALSKLVHYLLSENFAERFKVATGETFGEDLHYDLEFIENAQKGYMMKDRVAPEELVDPGRSEDLVELVEDIEGLVEDVSRGVEDWN
ncbi:hypothetical protein ACK3SF_02665 [Candidatus Nanosalina sp. VS9-1]|uniref:hypothetical protein n=1 Tax=Candidatus Nanosalina sp. VS9-1 TaxID=3388566 RepID=UPI0039E0FE22